MVRTYILTARERRILQRFIETGEKLNGFSVLVHHLRKAEKQLSTDLQLLRKVMEKKESIWTSKKPKIPHRT